ncbi:MAG: tRNA epoxyqueuosine(34) reductase QueG [Alphaproteobacteria bacterium]
MDTHGDAIRARALELGFDAVGVGPADIGARPGELLAAFLGDGAHGDMTWLAERADERRNPPALWDGVRSVVSVAMNYASPDDPLAALAHPERGAISVYARGDDYHDIMKKRLKELGRWVSDYLGVAVKVFVDTAPVMEKPIAQSAGLGWQGKHTNLVSRTYGSWLFLGEIFVAAELPPDVPHADRCGTCARCMTACPTEAFPAPYRLDARRCISYLTIEHKGHIDRALRPLIGNRLYGCDDCLAACPWNRFAQVSRHAQLWARAEFRAPALADLVGLTDGAFRDLFRKSPIKRTGRARFVRNVLIAIGNSGDRTLLPHVVERLRDESPLVRAMAVWALGRLGDADTLDRLASDHRAAETDPQVLKEWGQVQAP